MGKTVPSYLVALEIEIDRWREFKNALTKRDKEDFDELMGHVHEPRFGKQQHP